MKPPDEKKDVLPPPGGVPGLYVLGTAKYYSLPVRYGTHGLDVHQVGGHGPFRHWGHLAELALADPWAAGQMPTRPHTRSAACGTTGSTATAISTCVTAASTAPSMPRSVLHRRRCLRVATTRLPWCGSHGTIRLSSTGVHCSSNATTVDHQHNKQMCMIHRRATDSAMNTEH
jgi:hypothetical protein